MNNKHYRSCSSSENQQKLKKPMVLQRYIEHFPTGGEIVLFDRGNSENG